MAVGETTFALSNEATSFIVDVAKIANHPDYSSSSNANDISVLTLARPLDLTSHPNIKPACLPAAGATFSPSPATVSGWGTVASGLQAVVWLNKVEVQVFASCSEAGQAGTTEDMICAGVSQGGKDSCQGDSGDI